jgi:membrane protein required for colicin V production
MESFNNLDYVILIVAGASTILGIYWGLIRQVLAIVGLLVGVALAGRYGPDVAVWLGSFIDDPAVAGVIGFIAVMLLVSAAASLIASLLRIFAGLLFLGLFDHLLGGVLGFAQAMLVIAAMLVAMVTFPLPLWSDAIGDSTLAAPFLQFSGILTPMLPEMFTNAVRDALSLLR